ncbi:PilZ domain-containing protein [Salinimonas lutimaris]|uniref:PilZ domain-containing protein n=1 Tax=Salinimonas lutimaris TaxID=914153 RepID=UPI0010BFEDA0|nr:PilZ domain-containing protein [Salinimonas lutimaris]
MNDDLSRYRGIIEELKPYASRSDLNQKVNELAAHLPNDKRFLIKMEVKRLARPCMRSVDLRGHVNAECRLYEFGGVSHYLDDLAIQTFEKQVGIFGQFTFGVYEAVMETENNFRVMREKAEQQEKQEARQQKENSHALALEKYTVPVVNLLSYARRQHERMNFAVSVELVTSQEVHWHGNSVDISTEGLQVKLGQEAQVERNELVEIFFRGLEEEFAMDKKRGIVYEVLKIVEKNDFKYLMLKRASEIPNPPFDSFLENFIHGNKRRYKVNMANTIDAIFNKTVEQFLSPRSPSLPLFAEIQDGRLVARYAMQNEINTEILDYWRDEEEVLRIGYLANPNRLAWMAKQPAGQQEMYVFAFTHLQNEKVYFYSASTVELMLKPELRHAYLGFGSRKVSWRVFKLTMSSMSADQAHSPLSIPDTVSNKVKHLNQAPSARLMSKLKKLRFIVHVTDITSDTGQRHYNQYRFSRDNLTNLRIFGHARNKPPAETTTYRYHYQDKRMEKRYLLRTGITVRDVYSGESWQGVSEDISVRGLRIELASEFSGNSEAQLEIGFPKLQPLTDKFDVMALQYRIIHHNDEKNILHLKAVEGQDGAIARNFFTELIKRNKNALEEYPEGEDMPGMGHALRCINAKNTPSLAFVMTKEGARYLPMAAIVNRRDESINHVAALRGTEHQLNFEFMFRDRNLETPFIQHGIRQIKLEHLPIRQELYIAFDPSQKEGRMAILPRFDTRFISDDTRINFIEQAMERGQFIALHVLLTTTGKPDMELLEAEMSYVSMYAIHRAKELEARLWSIMACAHLVDITEEVLGRYNIDPEKIRQNRQFNHADAGSVISPLLQA